MKVLIIIFISFAVCNLKIAQTMDDYKSPIRLAVYVEYSQSPDPFSSDVSEVGQEAVYRYRKVGDFSLDERSDILVLRGVAQLEVFSDDRRILPFTSRPVFIAVYSEKGLIGRVLQFYENPEVGFYLVDGLKLDDSLHLHSDKDEIEKYPIVSAPLSFLISELLVKKGYKWSNGF